MAFGIVLSIVAVAGIIYGIKSKNKTLGIVSAIALLLIIAVWIYFYSHPY